MEINFTCSIKFEKPWIFLNCLYYPTIHISSKKHNKEYWLEKYFSKICAKYHIFSVLFNYKIMLDAKNGENTEKYRFFFKILIIQQVATVKKSKKVVQKYVRIFVKMQKKKCQKIIFFAFFPGGKSGIVSCCYLV